ncbi:MAG: NADH:ubiquinone oxidoreductase [Eggerthellaceae bacterium]|nr:NADH:ubiquinone oxidoreductase [Eggerthellaceae bacterium]
MGNKGNRGAGPSDAGLRKAGPRSGTPRVVVVGLASCFGCQLQITNNEKHLLEVLGQFDLTYWQLLSSAPMPEDFDVAIIEGAVTTEESVQVLAELRAKAQVVIALGACANTAGIPGIAAKGFCGRPAEVYSTLPSVCGDLIAPRSVTSVIEVDYQVPCCPIDPSEFLEVLSKAFYGSNRPLTEKTMCGDCKRNETGCFYPQQELCLGLVTRAGCGARCVKVGRPCSGCRGISPEANLASARESVVRYGLAAEGFDAALELFNQTNPLLQGKD